MPGPKPQLHLPYGDWPATDRLLWEHAFDQDDPFAEIRLAKASRDRCMWSWRRFLGFVANNEPEALDIAPSERLTLARVKSLVAHLATTNAPNSVAAVIDGLYTAARVMMPDRDWSWLRAIKLRLHAAVPAHSPGGPEITSVPLLELALKLMDESKQQLNAKFDIRQAIAFRDGLMLGFVAYIPLRPKNLASIPPAASLFWNGTGGSLSSRGRKPRPKSRTSSKYRRSCFSPKGGALSYVGISKSFARLSKCLGVQFSIRPIRDQAASGDEVFVEIDPWQFMTS